MSATASEKRTGRKWHQDRFLPSEDCVHQACVVCGKSMWFPPSKAGKYLTCGRECNAARRSALKSQRKRNCETCGNEFYPRPAQINAGAGRYCSQKCNRSSHEAMNSKDAQRRARAAWRKTLERECFFKSGPENPMWKGGRRATYIRQREAGVYRKASHDRWVRMGKKLKPGTVERIGDRQGWRCAICGKCVREKFYLDHIYPLSKGGQHEESNLQILCASCNRSKGAKDPIDYMQSRGRLL